jgi:GntR family transcriptional regulator
LPVNSGIGVVLRVIIDADGRAIYVGQAKYRGDFVNLEFDLEEPPK